MQLIHLLKETSLCKSQRQYRKPQLVKIHRTTDSIVLRFSAYIYTTTQAPKNWESSWKGGWKDC